MKTRKEIYKEGFPLFLIVLLKLFYLAIVTYLTLAVYSTSRNEIISNESKYIESMDIGFKSLFMESMV